MKKKSKYLVIYEEAISHVTLHPIPSEFSYEENFIFLFNSACTFASMIYSS